MAPADFPAAPWRDGDRLIWMEQLHFRYHQRSIGCVEHIHNPVAIRQIKSVANLVQLLAGEGQHLDSILVRNGIFEFHATQGLS